MLLEKSVVTDYIAIEQCVAYQANRDYSIDNIMIKLRDEPYWRAEERLIVYRQICPLMEFANFVIAHKSYAEAHVTNLSSEMWGLVAPESVGDTYIAYFGRESPSVSETLKLADYENAAGPPLPIVGFVIGNQRLP
ncbi:hypothetical protein J6590_048355 [Homalodisca vitripennis]|nr:hypothetical protein J6590_048355 [Homalodisca vitripennis]